MKMMTAKKKLTMKDERRKMHKGNWENKRGRREQKAVLTKKEEKCSCCFVIGKERRKNEATTAKVQKSRFHCCK